MIVDTVKSRVNLNSKKCMIIGLSTGALLASALCFFGILAVLIGLVAVPIAGYHSAIRSPEREFRSTLLTAAWYVLGLAVSCLAFAAILDPKPIFDLRQLAEITIGLIVIQFPLFSFVGWIGAAVARTQRIYRENHQ